MNLTQVLNVTLPEPPAMKVHDRYPCVSPKMIAREHKEREGLMVHIIIPDGPSHFFRFSPQQYELIKLFDGRRSYAEIARKFMQEQNIKVNEDFVRTFADNMEKKEFWYRTPQEESITLFNKLAGDRHKTLQKKHGKSAAADLAIIELVYFDPDNYLTWIHKKLKFMYTTRYTLFALFMVGVMCAILGSRWDEVWADSVLFYNFTQKGLLDIVEFFLIFALLGAVHETAHGMTCKHYGGESHKMGAFLMYLMPGVFCDVTQIYVYGGRWARVATLFAGVWSEIMICSWVTVLWWLTPQGTWLHDFCYKLILSGGIFVVIINLNPLARMDGYYIFCELTRFFDLKGNSTSLLSNMVRKHIFRMPATVPILPWDRKLFFMAYAAMAGMYSYLLLLFFVRISYRVLYNYTPEWAFVPSGLIAIMIFKSRIKKLMAFLKAFYLDKRDLFRANLLRIAVGSAAVILLGMIPIWRDSLDERFVLEPIQRASVRTQVPGMVTSVMTGEGQHVMSGQPVATLRNLHLETEAAMVNARYQQSNARSIQTSLRYTDHAAADQERLRDATLKQIVASQQEQLTLKSPISGTVLGTRLEDLEGSFLKAGTLITEIGDTTAMRAEIYIPESELEKLEKLDMGKTVLRMDSSYKPMHADIESMTLASRVLEKGLEPPAKYKGMRLPTFYVLRLRLVNPDGKLMVGMTGTAHLLGARKSTWGVLFRPVIDAVARRAW